MERLSALDASFLYLESPTQAMNAAVIVRVDPSTVPGGYSFDSVRAEAARRMRALPRFRRRLADAVTNVDRPVWVEDRDFDVDRHIRRLAVPSPGGPVETAQTCEALLGRTLDRSRPLWDLWVAEGLADGRVALMLRVHQAMLDGDTVTDLLAELLTPTPQPPVLQAKDVKASAGEAPLAEITVSGAINALVQRPLAAARLVGKTLPVPWQWLKRIGASGSPFPAPRTPFDGALTAQRSIALGRLPFGDCTGAADRYGATVDDVVLAVIAGALRGHLSERGALPSAPLVALASGANGDGRSELVTRLPTDVDDPVERLRAAASYTDRARRGGGDVDPELLRAFAEVTPGFTLGALSRLHADRRVSGLRPPLCNLLISRLDGPAGDAYLLGGRVDAVHPLVPIFHGLGLAVTLCVTGDDLNVGIVTCPDLDTDVGDLDARLTEQLALLTGDDQSGAS
ncbi:MAG: wax ester/triacylglycerol synthase family O-acyltransferase [Gordonia sp. (in: high G+C Gram-positive bacteria)]|uniref:wax ester/triacylglycerol synthase family O-acyltransferase n=1 Tax=Gordonia sp. (in: high G+C Gram-positive bacteria) TaxID=84139 RepID=UPI0039E2826C